MQSPSRKVTLSAVALIAGMLFNGCTETGVTPNTPFRDVVCPNTECDKRFTLDAGELATLEACYQSIDRTPPDEILECLSQGGDCTIPAYEGFITNMQDRGCCVDEFPNYPDNPPPDLCLVEGESDPVLICTVPTNLSANNEWNDAGADLVAALQNDCDFELVADPPFCVGTGEGRTWGEICPAPK